MSLDIYLCRPEEEGDKSKCERCQYCPDCGGTGVVQADRIVWQENLTHNLNTMADHAGLYDVMWRPEKLFGEKITAGQLIPALTAGVAALAADPERFIRYEPANKWGSYDGLLREAKEYLRQCVAHPELEVSVSR